jgi:hypothetical protein
MMLNFNTFNLQQLALWSRTFFCILTISFSPLFAVAAPIPTGTLVDEIEVVRRHQQLFLYLHSNAPITHQSLETTSTHLTLALEQVKLSTDLRTNYLNAPNINSIIVKKLPNNTVRLEIDGTDLNEPIIGFRELSGQVIPTAEKIDTITLQNKLTFLNTVPTAAIPTNNPQQAIVVPPTNSQTIPRPIVAKTTPAISTTMVQATEEAEENTNSWQALLLRIIMFATRHIDWCLYALGGTMLLSLLTAFGLKRKQMVEAPTLHYGNRSFSNSTPPIQSQQNNIIHGTPSPVPPKANTLKETLPPTHQRILDRVQRQMDGTAPSIPNTTAFKSVPSMPVSQASRQYQQQQNFNTVKPAKAVTPMNAPILKKDEATGNNTANFAGQKAVRPWQPERLTDTESSASLPASGEAFLQSMSNFLDPESKKNIQQGLLNKRAL